MLPKFKTPIDDLQKLTVEQIKTAVTADMTKRDLLILANDGMDRIAVEPVRTYRKDKQIESQSEVFKDVETNAVILTKTTTWTYYKTGEVDTITINENGKTKIIKHYIVGRQPEVTK